MIDTQKVKNSANALFHLVSRAKIEIIQHADERRTGKSLNEYQFSTTSSDESAQRATSGGKLIRVQGFSCPEVMSACCITIPATTEQRRHHNESIQIWLQYFVCDLFLRQTASRLYTN